MLPLVVPFGRPASGSVVTVATVLDDPGRPTRPATPAGMVPRVPRRCRHCHRRVRGLLRDGLGPKCWARLNQRPRMLASPVFSPRRRAAVDHQSPDLLDLLTDLHQGRHVDLHFLRAAIDNAIDAAGE